MRAIPRSLLVFINHAFEVCVTELMVILLPAVACIYLLEGAAFGQRCYIIICIGLFRLCRRGQMERDEVSDEQDCGNCRDIANYT